MLDYKKWIFAAGAGVVWLFTLVNGTGLGETYGTVEKSQMLLLLAAGLCAVIQFKRNPIVQKETVLFGVLLLFAFVLIPWYHTGEFTIQYIYVFLLPFVLSQICVKKAYIRVVSLLYGALGFAVLILYNYTGLFKGWNHNSIAMLVLFSFAVFTIPFWVEKRLSSRVLFAVISILYAHLMMRTDSRSSTLVMLVSMVVIILGVKFITPRNEKLIVFLLLLIPLAVTAVTILIAHSEFFAPIDAWSMETFQKPIFNGRDTLWLSGYEKLRENLLFGNGELLNHLHNSAITCLTAYGTAGYALWVILFQKILDQSRWYLRDPYVYGAVFAFFMIYIQQSVELGLIATEPNFIPYFLLGLILGQVRNLRQQEET